MREGGPGNRPDDLYSLGEGEYAGIGERILEVRVLYEVLMVRERFLRWLLLAVGRRGMLHNVYNAGGTGASAGRFVHEGSEAGGSIVRAGGVGR